MCPETSVGLRKYLGVRADIGEMGAHRAVPVYVAINIDERAEVQHYPGAWLMFIVHRCM